MIVQLLSEILIHASPAPIACPSSSSSCAAAPAVAPVEKAALSSRVDGEGGRHGLTAPRHQLSVPVYLRGDAVDATVAVLASLAQNPRDVLRDGKNKRDFFNDLLKYIDINA